MKKVFFTLLLFSAFQCTLADKLNLIQGVTLGFQKGEKIDSTSYIVKIKKDSVLIDTIEVATNNVTHKVLTIIDDKNDSIFSGKLKNTLISNEKGKKIIFKVGIRYIFSIDKKIFTVIVKKYCDNATQSSTENSKSDIQTKSMNKSVTQDAKDNTGILLIIGLVCFIVGFFIGKVINIPIPFIHKNNTTDSDTKNPKTDEEMTSESDVEGVITNGCHDSANEENKVDANSCVEEKNNIFLDSIEKDIPGIFEKCESNDDKKNYIIELLLKQRKESNQLKELLQSLDSDSFEKAKQTVDAFNTKKTEPCVEKPSWDVETILSDKNNKNSFETLCQIWKSDDVSHQKDDKSKLERLFRIIEPKLNTNHQKTQRIITVDELEGLKNVDEKNALNIVVHRRMRNLLRNHGYSDFGVILPDNGNIDDFLKTLAIMIKESISKPWSQIDDQKVLDNVIQGINAKLPNDRKLEGISDLNDLYDSLATKLEVPKTEQEAEERGKKIVISLLETIIGVNGLSFEKESIKNSIDSYCKDYVTKNIVNRIDKLNDEEKADLNVLIECLNRSIEDSSKVKGLVGQYKVVNLDDLPEAVKQNELDTLKSTLSGNQDLPDNFDVKKYPSMAKLVNDLLKSYKQSVNDKKHIETSILDKLKAYYSQLSGEELAADGIDSAYSLFEEKINSTKETIEDYIKKNSDLTSEKTNLTNLLNINKEIISSESKQIKETVLTLVYDLEEQVNNGGFLKAIDVDSKDSCKENKDRLKKAINTFIEKIKKIDFDNIKTPAELLLAISQVLKGDIDEDSGCINVISRYYAYSKLPFMQPKGALISDSRIELREYGLIFNYSYMEKMYSIISRLLTICGMYLIIPNLYACKFCDDDYENVTGIYSSDIENFCPGSKNFLEMISNEDRKGIIIDLLKVGYRDKDKIIKSKVIINS